MDDLLDSSHLGLSITTASPVMWRTDAGSKCKCMSKPSGRIWYPLTLRALPTRFTDSPPTASASRQAACSWSANQVHRRARTAMSQRES